MNDSIPHNVNYGADILRRLLNSGFAPDHLMGATIGKLPDLISRLDWLMKRDLSFDQHPEFRFEELERDERQVRTLIVAEFHEWLQRNCGFNGFSHVECSLALFAFGCENHDRAKRTAYAVRCFYRASGTSGLIGQRQILRTARFDPEKPSNRKEPKRFRIGPIEFAKLQLNEICDAMISWRTKGR